MFPTKLNVLVVQHPYIYIQAIILALYRNKLLICFQNRLFTTLNTHSFQETEILNILLNSHVQRNGWIDVCNAVLGLVDWLSAMLFRCPIDRPKVRARAKSRRAFFLLLCVVLRWVIVFFEFNNTWIHKHIINSWTKYSE